MSILPLFIVLTVVISTIAHINQEKIIEIVNQLFPKVTQNFLMFIFNMLSEKRTIFGVFGFLLAFYFSTRLFATLHNALVYVYDGKDVGIKRTAIVYLLGVPIFHFIIVAIYIIGLFITSFFDLLSNTFFLEYLMSIATQLGLKDVILTIFGSKDIITIFSFFIIYAVVYHYLAPRESRNLFDTVLISVFSAFFLYFLKALFNHIIIYSTSVNPIYGSLSGIFAFLLWLHMGFSSILIGARVIYYLERFRMERRILRNPKFLPEPEQSE